MGYLTLFFSALTSATILPGSSEVLLSAMLTTQKYLIWMLCLSATLGNLLGSCINYWLGFKILDYKDHKWFPVGEANLSRAEAWFNKYGLFCLFFAWLPIVGDALTVIAGVFKVRLWSFIWIVGLGKAIRYWVITILTLELLKHI